MQWAISLLTTRGKVNPLAIALLIGTAVFGAFGYFKFTSLLSELELVRQSKVVLQSCTDKTVKLNEARNEQKKANSVVGTDAWHDWAKRVQNTND